MRCLGANTSTELGFFPTISRAAGHEGGNQNHQSSRASPGPSVTILSQGTVLVTSCTKDGH